MTCYRPYRAGMPRDKALAIMRGTQFDAQFADAFLALGEAGELDPFIGHSDDSIPLQTCPMCGPTLVVQRGQRAEEHIYCRNCSGEFTLEQEITQLAARPTGGMGYPQALAPQVYGPLIAATVNSAAALSANGLVADIASRWNTENR